MDKLCEDTQVVAFLLDVTGAHVVLPDGNVGVEIIGKELSFRNVYSVLVQELFIC